MATRSSILAWRIPRTEEPDSLCITESGTTEQRSSHSPQEHRETGWFHPDIQFSLSVVSDSLRPHELQNARPPSKLLEFTQTYVY